MTLRQRREKYEKKRKSFGAFAGGGFDGRKCAGNGYGGRWCETQRWDDERTAILEWNGRKFAV